MQRFGLRGKLLWSVLFVCPLVMLQFTRIALATPADAASVTVLRTPNGGIEPQAVLGHDGVLRMIYFEGNAGAGNIEYVERQPHALEYSAPIRVNSQPDSAVARGAVRGPQMAVGRDGRVYVIWFGSSRSEPRGPQGGTPVLYSRLEDSGHAFTPQRNLDQYTREVDGGLSIAADKRGDVYAVWHARGVKPGEEHRRVYLSVSRNDGRTFSRETSISPASLGACGCCGMKAFVDRRGTLFVLYRAAAQNVHRDMTLLISSNLGRSFSVRRLSQWKLDACPMSTADLTEGGGDVLASWERAGQVYFDEIDPRTLQIHPAVAPPGAEDMRKHPVVAKNSRGQILFAWTVGMVRSKGGSVAWQLFNADGKPARPERHAPALPTWGLISVYAGRDGSFTLIY